MPSSAYFRRQADICLRLSLIASDEEVSSRLIAMARDYKATGDALAKEAGSAGVEIADPHVAEGHPGDATMPPEHDTSASS